MTEGRQPFTAEIKTLAKGPSTYDPLETEIRRLLPLLGRAQGVEKGQFDSTALAVWPRKTTAMPVLDHEGPEVFGQQSEPMGCRTKSKPPTPWLPVKQQRHSHTIVSAPVSARYIFAARPAPWSLPDCPRQSSNSLRGGFGPRRGTCKVSARLSGGPLCNRRRRKKNPPSWELGGEVRVTAGDVTWGGIAGFVACDGSGVGAAESKRPPVAHPCYARRKAGA
jgi:hypothetical protein